MNNAKYVFKRVEWFLNFDAMQNYFENSEQQLHERAAQQLSEVISWVFRAQWLRNQPPKVTVTGASLEVHFCDLFRAKRSST